MAVLPSSSAGFFTTSKSTLFSSTTKDKKVELKIKEIDNRTLPPPSSDNLTHLSREETKQNEAGTNDLKNSFVFVEHKSDKEFRKFLNCNKTSLIPDNSNKLKSEQNNDKKGVCPEVIWTGSSDSLVESLNESLPDSKVSELTNTEIKNQLTQLPEKKLPEALRSITLEQLAGLRDEIARADIDNGGISESDPKLDAVNRAIINEAADRPLRMLKGLAGSSKCLSHLIALAEVLQTIGKYAEESTTITSILFYADNFLKSANFERELATSSLEELQQLKKLIPVLKKYDFEVEPGFKIEHAIVDCLRKECSEAAHNFTQALIGSKVDSIIEAVHTLIAGYDEFIDGCKKYSVKIDRNYQSFIIESIKSLDKNQKKALARTLRTDGITQLEQNSKAVTRTLSALQLDQSKLFKAIVDSLDAAESALGWIFSIRAEFARLLRLLTPPNSSTFAAYIDRIQKEFGAVFTSQKSVYTSQVTDSRHHVPEEIFKAIKQSFEEREKEIHDRPVKKELIKGLEIDNQYILDMLRNGLENPIIDGKIFRTDTTYPREAMTYIIALMLQNFCKPKELLKISHYFSQSSAADIQGIIQHKVIKFNGQSIMGFGKGLPENDNILTPNLYRDTNGKIHLNIKFEKKEMPSVCTSEYEVFKLSPKSYMKWEATLTFDQNQKLEIVHPVTYEYDLIPA